MATTLALIAVTAAAALALLLPGTGGDRARAGAMALALIGAPIILLAQVWDTGPIVSLRDQPLVLVGAIAAGLVLLVVAAAVLGRWPLLVPLAAVFALPFRLPIDLGDGQPVNLLLPLYLVAGAAALAWVWERWRRDPDLPSTDPRPAAMDVVLLLFVVLYAIQSAGSVDQDRAVEQVAFFYVPFALLFVVLRTFPWTPRIAGQSFVVVIVVALTLAAVGFYEFATNQVLLNPRVVASNQIEDVFRVNSLFFDPNIYGRFLALVLLGICARMLWTRRGSVVAGTGLLLTVLLAALVLTYSQTSFAALLAGLAILGGLRFGPWKAFGVTVAVVGVGVVLVLAAPSALNIKGLDRHSVDQATTGRVALTGGGIALFANQPIEGVGSGGFARAYRRAERTSSQSAVDASHTIPVTIAAEQGAIGLVAYLALLVLILVRLLRRAEESAVRAAIAAMTVALIVHTMGYAAFLEDPVLWVLLAVGSSLAARPPEDVAVPRVPGDAPRDLAATAASS